jgi:hypothetical protein
VVDVLVAVVDPVSIIMQDTGEFTDIGCQGAGLEHKVMHPKIYI